MRARRACGALGLVVLAIAQVGCLSTFDLGDSVDLDMLGTATHYRGWTNVNRAPYVSSIASNQVSVWVMTPDAAAYEAIRPEVDGSNAMVPRGTVIVREVLDASGQVAKLTMMAKGPEGYDPTLGDWWFAVTDPLCNPLSDDAGAEMVGRMEACHECHADRAADDFLFGVTGAAR